MLRKATWALGALLALFMTASAQADTIVLRFTRVPSSFDWDVGEPTQFFVEVSDTETDGETPLGNSENDNRRVRFSFWNEVGEDIFLGYGTPSSIQEVYFDGGPLLQLDDYINSTESNDFMPNSGDHPNLPDGGNLDPPFISDFQLGASSIASGLDNASERLHVFFELFEGMTLANVVTALRNGDGEGGLRIGLHVHGIDGTSRSESFVNIPPVPTPGAAAGGLALLGLVATRRRAGRAA